MQSCCFDHSHLEKIHRIIESFIWAGKRPKIKYNQLISSYEQGGLCAPDVVSQYKAIQLTQYLRASRSEHSIKYCQNEINTFKGPIFDTIKELILGALSDATLSIIDDSFNQAAFEFLLACPYQYFINTNNKSSLISLNKKLGTNKVCDVFNEICFPRFDNNKLDRLILTQNFLSKILIEKYANYQCKLFINDYINDWYLGGNSITKIENLTSGKIKKRLVQFKSIKISPDDIANKFFIERPLQSANNPFINLHKNNRSIRHKVAKFKMLHNCIYLNNRLFRIGLKESSSCDACDAKDGLRHRLVECCHTIAIWDELNILSTRLFNSPLEISFADCFFGIQHKIKTTFIVKLFEFIVIKLIKHTDNLKPNLKLIIKEFLVVERKLGYEMNDIESDVET